MITALKLYYELVIFNMFIVFCFKHLVTSLDENRLLAFGRLKKSILDSFSIRKYILRVLSGTKGNGMMTVLFSYLEALK